MVGVIGPLDVRLRRGYEQGVHAGRHRAGLGLGDAHDADQGRQPGGQQRLLPRRARPTTIQGPTDAKYMLNTLKVKNVVVFDFQEPYSWVWPAGREGAQGCGRDCLASVDRRTRSRTSRPTSRTCRATPTSCSSRRRSRATRRPSRAARGAGQEGQGLRRRRLERLGAVQGGRFVRVELRPDISAIAADKAIIAGWQKDNKGKPSAPSARRPTAPSRSSSRRSRPPAPRASGTIAKRGAVIGQMKKVHDQQGLDPRRQVRVVEDQHARPATPKFYIMQIQSDGSYKLVN